MSKLLQSLEEEAISIIRESYSHSLNSVMMYSIGKDSSVLLHLARKAFYPSNVPFPLLHIDTGWKFKEMISFKIESGKLSFLPKPRPLYEIFVYSITSFSTKT